MTLKDFLNEKDIFAANAGMELVEVREGYSRAVMTVGKSHLNAGGVCQGGALFTLADLALAAVMNSHGQLTLSIESTITFLHSAVAVSYTHLDVYKRQYRCYQSRRHGMSLSLF